MPALFARDGDLFVPSEVCRGGWDDRHQHGSPPAGLLGWATEQVPTAQPMQVVGFHVELFRPVPLTPLRVETTVVRDGRRIQVVDAALFSGELQVGRASALRFRIADWEMAPHFGTPNEMPGGPEELTPLDWDPNDDRDEMLRFHVHGVEIRSFDDSFSSQGPGTSWFRLKQPLFEDEPVSPFVRVATISDLSNGNAQRLDVRDWTYINADISLYLHRMPVGEWVGMVSHVDQHRTGIGVVSTVVYDTDGPIGTINQAQLIDAR